MHFWELYLSCMYCLCVYVCTLCVFVVVRVFVVLLCVFVVSYAYLLYFLCVFVVPYVYLLYYVCIAVLTLEAVLLARSQYPEGPATDHLDTVFFFFFGFPVSTSKC